MINFKFWFAYLMFIMSPRKTSSRINFAKDMLQSASTFSHCAKILAPLTKSFALSRLHARAFQKALHLAETYEQALCLCNWTQNKKEKEQAYSLMVNMTSDTCGALHFNELVKDYGLGLKIASIDSSAHSKLKKLFVHHQADSKLQEFLISLKIDEELAGYRL